MTLIIRENARATDTFLLSSSMHFSGCGRNIRGDDEDA